ncbi:MAG: DUF2249 domain-containing protein, partial [Clostridia bacterium]
RRWPDYRTGFDVLRNALLVHMAFEEEAVFPLLEAGARAAVRERREEHARIEAEVEILKAAAPEHDPEGCIAELEQLAALLAAHHAAEMALDPQYATRPIPALVQEGTAALDLRGLQPPEPIVRILAALERSPREPLRVILPHEPVPLYALLRERGCTYSGTLRRDGGYELLIEAS